MSEASDLAEALKREITRKPPAHSRFYRVSVDPGSHLAVLRGGGMPEPMPVGHTNWCGAFAAAVDAGSADGRMVLVTFVDGQPVIVDVMG